MYDHLLLELCEKIYEEGMLLYKKYSTSKIAPYFPYEDTKKNLKFLCTHLDLFDTKERVRMMIALTFCKKNPILSLTDLTLDNLINCMQSLLVSPYYHQVVRAFDIMISYTEACPMDLFLLMMIRTDLPNHFTDKTNFRRLCCTTYSYDFICWFEVALLDYMRDTSCNKKYLHEIYYGDYGTNSDIFEIYNVNLDTLKILTISHIDIIIER
jgi:hypothetical protein